MVLTSADILCVWSCNEWTGDVVVTITPFPLRYYPVFHGGSFPRLLAKTAEPELQFVCLKMKLLHMSSALKASFDDTK